MLCVQSWLIVLALLLLGMLYQARSLRYPTIFSRRRLTQSGMSTEGFTMLKNIITVEGVVCKGYGRGSKKLGYPTANLPQFHEDLKRNSVDRGIYFGWCTIESEGYIRPCVTNIGISPTFIGQENAANIIESYVIDRPVENGDFYDHQFRLALVGYIRPEIKFTDIDDLINQIHSDVEIARAACLEITGADNTESVEKTDNKENTENTYISSGNSVVATIKESSVYNRCFIDVVKPFLQRQTALGRHERNIVLKFAIAPTSPESYGLIMKAAET